GRWSSGSSRVAGGVAGLAGSVPGGCVGGLWREKFIEGLPFVVGQDAEVAVEGEAGGLERDPGLDEGVLRGEDGVLGGAQFDRLRGLAGGVRAAAAAPPPRAAPAAGAGAVGRGDDLLEGVVLLAEVQQQDALLEGVDLGQL